MGASVGPTKFIPMKTPFSQEIISSFDDKVIENRLTVDSMVLEQNKLGREIGMILDVSDHTCLYQQDMPVNIEYQQVRLVAKQLPSHEVVRKVHAVANEFWSRYPNKYIAIHCAYGFNRTGFLVCAYLVEMLDMSVEEALNCFEIARPPGIRHEKFVDELIKRYNGTVTSCEGAVTTSSMDSSVPLDLIQCSSFGPIGLSPSRESLQSEVDNESLGFEQREVLSALHQQQLQQLRQNGQIPIKDGFCKNNVQKQSNISRKRIQDMYWGHDKEQTDKIATAQVDKEIKSEIVSKSQSDNCNTQFQKQFQKQTNPQQRQLWQGFFDQIGRLFWNQSV
eukprot:TRINITY_DN56779_c0_g4_i2.p1 TRINITY_DN56779_c0_g4~~TRINITY_DN56779_c0_g4_i2.p1  ORF type:complete len:335 (-),score=36.89 TRINITY_DN56779_c0_g4_i2:104-1108(-)